MLAACLSSGAALALWLPGLRGGTGCCGVIALDRSPALGTGCTGCTWPTEENWVFLNSVISTVFYVLYTKRRLYLFKGSHVIFCMSWQTEELVDACVSTSLG